jgi:hypothetical protein
MTESILDLSRELFTGIVLPILQQQFPNETNSTAFGLFGYGSDAYLLDDEISQDHHWGIPYDKWLMAYFPRLPRLCKPLEPLVDEAVLLTTGWERKLDLLHGISDVLDQAMVEDGIIKPHPPFAGSPTSGYRLLEHAYAELIQSAPEEIKTTVPVWDQIYLEQFHSRYVNGVDLKQWDSILGLTEITAVST